MAGYYTLSAASFEFESLPVSFQRRVPRYPIPAVLIGRFAVDNSWQGKKFGARLAVDALQRVIHAAQDIAIHLVLVDTKYANAKAIHRHFGFIEFADHALKMFLPLVTIRKLYLVTTFAYRIRGIFLPHAIQGRAHCKILQFFRSD